MISERKNHVFVQLVKNELIKFYSTKMMFIIVILLMLGVFLFALKISAEPETVSESYMTEIDYEIQELEDIINTGGMSGTSYYINKLETDYYMKENNISPIKVHSIGNLVLSVNQIFAIVVMIMILGAGKIFSDEYTYQTLTALISRPCSRVKIFFSKIVTLLSFCVAIEALLIIFTVLIGGIFFGFDGLNDTVVSYNNGIVVRSVLGQAMYYNFFNLFTLIACATMTVLLSLLIKNGIIAICSGIIIYTIGSSMILSLTDFEFLKYSLLANIQFQIYFDGNEFFEGMNEWTSIINILIHSVIFIALSLLLFYKRNADE